jgi:DNA sulfur modification protein DndB
MDDQMYEFTAIRGRQAGREYYILLCPLKLIPKIFSFDGSDVPPEIRAQRVLNKGRIPEIKQYILDNPEDYIFSALTASVDSEVSFNPSGEGGHQKNIGILRIPMLAKIIINDGQHRRSAIKAALDENPEFGHDHIGIILFVDHGLKRAQQMFADLNRNAIRPTKSLGILYDHRDALSKLARDIVEQVHVFSGMTEMEKTSISNRSTQLFTLSGIYHATMALLGKKSQKKKVTLEETQFAIEFWKEVCKHMHDWKMAKKKEVSGYILRQKYIHAHGICLQALGHMGADLLELKPDSWKKSLKKLEGIDWSRSSIDLWEGRAMLGGKVNKARQNVILTTIAIKQKISLPLSESEQETEKEFLSMRRIRK